MFKAKKKLCTSVVDVLAINIHVSQLCCENEFKDRVRDRLKPRPTSTNQNLSNLPFTKIKYNFLCFRDWWRLISRLWSIFINRDVIDERLKTTKSEAMQIKLISFVHIWTRSTKIASNFFTLFDLEQNGQKLYFIKWTMLIGLCQLSLE